MDVDMDCHLDTLDNMSSGAMIQRQIIDGAYETIIPTTLNPSVIEFRVHSHDKYIELDRTELEVKFRIKKADGTNLGVDEKVGIINYPGATLFKDIEVKLNEKTITYSGSNYAERAIMETLLSFGKDASKSWLQSGLFYKDTPGKMDVADPTDAAPNEGLKKRVGFTAESKLVVTRSKLHLDIFNQSKPLINNVRMVLKLTRNKDAYVLMSSEAGAAYKVEIEDIALIVRKVEVSDTVHDTVEGKNTRKNIIPYPLTRVIQKEFTIPKGGKSFTENNLYDDYLPTKIVIGLVNNLAHVGSYTHNPFNFHHYDVSELSLKKNGQVVNGRPLTFDFDNDQYTDGYWSLHRAMDQRFRDEGSQIERIDYKGGYTLFAFDLSPSQCGDQFIDPKTKGKVTLELKFAKNIPHTLTLCVYLQFDNELQINEAGEVITLFS